MTEHDIVVVGGGAAGLVVAFGAAAAGADVGLVEANRVGGECTWTGCIPSKTLIDAARRVHEANNSESLGIRTHDVTVDFGMLMQHIRQVSETIAAEEGPDRLARAGISLYPAFARFQDAHTLALDDGSTIVGARIVLATGGRPHIPVALAPVRHLTNETIWELTELPQHLIVIGGGAIGCEFAQAFGRLGSKVTMISDVDRLIPFAHPDASSELARSFESEGINLNLGRTVISGADSESSVRLALDDGSVCEGSHVLVATGRDASITTMHPERAGIEVSERGDAILDAGLRTTQPHIFVCGDAAGAGFTHIASSQAAGVLVNLFLPRAVAVDSGIERWAIFTDPEIAHVGPLNSAPAARPGSNDPRTTTRVQMGRSDRASVQSASTGFIEARHTKTGRIESVTIVGPHAAELANQWVRPVSKRARMSGMAFAETIYPTMGSVNAVMAYEWGLALLERRVIGRVVRWGGRLRMRLMRNS